MATTLGLYHTISTLLQHQLKVSRAFKYIMASIKVSDHPANTPIPSACFSCLVTAAKGIATCIQPTPFTSGLIFPPLLCNFSPNPKPSDSKHVFRAVWAVNLQIPDVSTVSRPPTRFFAKPLDHEACEGGSMAGFYSLLKSLKSEVVLALSHVPRVIKTTPLFLINT
jgi:hypothetical protein